MITLCFHKVGPIEEEGRSLNIEPANLKRLIKWLKNREGQFVQAWQLADPWPKKGICLTFDDCYLSTLTHGLEVLREEAVTGSFYAVSNLVGKTSAWDATLARPLADWDLLRNAQAEGFEIGCHTASHVRLGDLDLEQQRKEILVCSEKMRQEGLDPKSFCLPYGSYNGQTAGAIDACGYKVGLALNKRSATESDNKLLLPRVVVACSDSPASLAYKLWVKPKLYRLLGRA